jgi:tetratricopeptide (TPR) repeat protein
MEEHHDIYKKPGDAPHPAPALPAYELTPEQVRTRTRRQTVMFSAIMVGLLAAAATYFYVQELGQHKTELEEALSTPVPPRKTPGLPLDPAVEPFPREEIDAAAQQPPEGISPQKMADAMGHLRIANDHLGARRFDPAEAEARKALRVWPEMNAAMRMLGMIYTQRGQFDQAIAALERSLKTDPFNPETYNNLGAAYMQKRLFNKAEEYLLTGLQIRPGYAVAQLNLGLLYIVWGRYDQAVDNLEDALQQMPDNANLLNNIAVSFIRLGRYDDARRHLERLIELRPETAAAYFNMAISHTLEQNFPGALEWIRKGMQHCDPAAAQSFLADADFDSLRNYPEFQQMIKRLYPELPASPGI